MRRTSFLVVVYLVVAVIVAYSDDYFVNLDRTKWLLSARGALVSLQL